MTQDQQASTTPVLTEEDLRELDTQSVLDEAVPATDPWNARFQRLGAALAVVTTVAIGVLMFGNVVMRYVFGTSLALATEGPTYLFPWLIAGGAIVAQAQLGHASVDLLLDLLKPGARRAFSAFVWIVTTMILAYGAYLALYMAGAIAGQRTIMLSWPTVGSFSAMVFMLAAMAIQAAVRVVYTIREPATGREDTDRV